MFSLFSFYDCSAGLLTVKYLLECSYLFYCSPPVKSWSLAVLGIHVPAVTPLAPSYQALTLSVVPIQDKPTRSGGSLATRDATSPTDPTPETSAANASQETLPLKEVRFGTILMCLTNYNSCDTSWLKIQNNSQNTILFLQPRPSLTRCLGPAWFSRLTTTLWEVVPSSQTTEKITLPLEPTESSLLPTSLKMSRVLSKLDFTALYS